MAFESSAQSGVKPRDIKEYNKALTVDLFRESGDLSMLEVSERTGLSKTTISKLFAEMVQEERIIQSGTGMSTSEGGKKPVLYRLNVAFGYIVFLSMGFARHISCTVADYCGNRIGYYRMDTPEDADYEDGKVLQMAADSVVQMLESLHIPYSRVIGVVIGYDGIVNTRKGTILQSAHRPWEGNLPICNDLKKRLPFDTRVVLNNASVFAAYAELAVDARSQSSRIVINWDENRTLGCSIFSGNQLMENSSGIEGGFSHIILDPSSKIPCRCGRMGCLQSLLSKESVDDYVNRVRGRYPDSALIPLIEAGTFDIKDIFIHGGRQDVFALDLMKHIVNYSSILLYNIFSIYSSRKIILQGVFSLSGDVFLNMLKDKLIHFNNLRLYSDVEVEYSRYSKGKSLSGTDPYIKGAVMYMSDLSFKVGGGKVENAQSTEAS